MDQVMPNAAATLITYNNSCNAARNSGSGELNDSQSFWASGRMHYGPIIGTLQTPNSKNADCCPYPAFASNFAMRSRHPGGVNALFADGSVKFIKDSVALNTWWALGTKAGGEVIDASSY
jgi:prepilin-type processing-associated H-X9-DG protein